MKTDAVIARPADQHIVRVSCANATFLTLVENYLFNQGGLGSHVVRMNAWPEDWSWQWRLDRQGLIGIGLPVESLNPWPVDGSSLLQDQPLALQPKDRRVLNLLSWGHSDGRLTVLDFLNTSKDANKHCGAGLK